MTLGDPLRKPYAGLLFGDATLDNRVIISPSSPEDDIRIPLLSELMRADGLTPASFPWLNANEMDTNIRWHQIESELSQADALAVLHRNGSESVGLLTETLDPGRPTFVLSL